MSATADQIRIAVSNHFRDLYDKGIKSMLQAGKPLQPRPLLALAGRIAKAVNHQYFEGFKEDWIPSVIVEPASNTMIGIGLVSLRISFVYRKGMSRN